ncbi:hypothetical protein PtrCC142_000110 [Pyrenophora tritici-repentis]|nr:hypothetical protein PtrSN001A_001887 [Pyrenophora tritici-repentis]KAI1553035.1 hypothetical protein PtrSN001C_000342 [Pyrenophora tritici-repentis]KAI1579472.1 hypothetical protein PtrEW4_000534 [Pyrenophora tritici-repentis]KAI1588705.1 hypothetical protein PtrEW7m1_000383 [Pyrenophora tritici-repentis]KAI1607713.1 hypothetical protein PtrCC142_000110 [Pyrenophora tritici-repentis]
MKKEAEEAVESAKGLLEDIVIVVSLVRTLTDSFGSVKDLYRKLKPKSKQKDSDSEDDKHHFRRPFHSRRDSGFSVHKKKESEFSDSEEELVCTSSIQVRAEYERGYRKLGEPFARGDNANHTASTNAPQYTPRPSTEHVYGAVIFALTPRAPPSDNSEGACGLDRGVELAVPAHAGTDANPVATSAERRSNLQYTWIFSSTRQFPTQ